MTPEESEKVLTEWNRLHTRALTLLDLDDRAGALLVLAEMEKLPFDEARSVAYDSAAPSETLTEMYGDKPGTGGRVKPMPGLSELEGDKR